MKSMQRRTPVSWQAFAVTAVVAVLALGAGAPAAFADSASISVTNTAGQSDPAALVPRVFTISGDASVPEEVFVKYRATGGAPCAPSAESDTGSKLSEGQDEGEWDFAYGDEVNGAFSLQQVYNWSPPGAFVFCIWLAPRESDQGAATITKPIEQTIAFRAPTGTITGSVSPASPRPGERATLTVSGTSESPEAVFAKIRKAGGAPCARTYAGDTGESLISDASVNGSFSVQATTTQAAAGTYVICLWLANSENDTSPVAGPQAISFTVGSPPPPAPRPHHNKPHKRAAPQHHARRRHARRPKHKRRARKHRAHKHGNRRRR